MQKLSITVIGQDLFKIVEDKFELADFNIINQVNTGMLGNLKMRTYMFEIDEFNIIEKRKMLMNEFAKDNMRLQAMFVLGDWMRIFIMKPIKT